MGVPTVGDGGTESFELGDSDLIIPALFPLRLPSLSNTLERIPARFQGSKGLVLCPSRLEDDKLGVPAQSYLVKFP